MPGPERTWFLGGGQADVGFDSVIRERRNSKLKVTKNPVADGVPISDHAYLEPKELEIEIRVSDTWLHARDEFGTVKSDPYTSQQGPDALALRGSTGETSRAATALTILYNLQESAEPFSVQTGLRLFPNMVIEEIEDESTVKNPTTLSARIMLVEVKRVSTRTVVYPPRKPGKPHRQASAKVDGGFKQPVEVTDPKQKETLLMSATQGAKAKIMAFISSLSD
jgi:Dit-like tail protein